MTKKASGDALDRALTALYQTDVTTGLQAAWRDAVKREEPSPMKPSNPRVCLAAARRASHGRGRGADCRHADNGRRSSPQTESEQPPAGAYTAAMDGEAYPQRRHTAEMTNAAAKLGYERSADTVLMDTSVRFCHGGRRRGSPVHGHGRYAAKSTAAQSAEPRKIVRTVSASRSPPRRLTRIMKPSSRSPTARAAMQAPWTCTPSKPASARPRLTLRIPAAGLDRFPARSWKGLAA